MTDLKGFETIEETLVKLSDMSDSFVTASVGGLLRSAPDLKPLLQEIRTMYSVKRSGMPFHRGQRLILTLTEKSIEILPTEGAHEATDEATAEVSRLEAALDALLVKYKKQYKWVPNVF